jgi:hypothetical protein
MGFLSLIIQRVQWLQEGCRLGVAAGCKVIPPMLSGMHVARGLQTVSVLHTVLNDVLM